MIPEIKKICKKNGFHSIIILLLLYFEKISLFKMPFRALRKIIVIGIYNCEIHPDSFVNIESLCTCRLIHPYLIIIHKNSRIGSNCTIYHNVTLGVPNITPPNQ